MLLERLKTLLGLAPTCEQVNDFLASYLEGELEAKTVTQFEAHIRMCEKCSRYLDQYRTTIDLVHEAGDLEPPPELVEMTLDFLRKRWDENSSPDRG